MSSPPAPVHGPIALMDSSPTGILLPMPSPSRPPLRKTYREVELVRLFTDQGRFGLGLVALALCTGVVGAVVLALISILRLVIERLL